MEEMGGRLGWVVNQDVKTFEDVDDTALPWRITDDERERISHECENLKLPSGYGSNLKDVMSHTGWLKIHDFTTLTSDVGKCKFE
jgi:hypothetical protein